MSNPDPSELMFYGRTVREITDDFLETFVGPGSNADSAPIVASCFQSGMAAVLMFFHEASHHDPDDAKAKLEALRNDLRSGVINALTIENGGSQPEVGG